MRFLLIALFACGLAACTAVNDPRIQLDPGFAAYSGCGINGKSYDAKDNIAVRIDGKVQFHRACKEPQASL